MSDEAIERIRKLAEATNITNGIIQIVVGQLFAAAERNNEDRLTFTRKIVFSLKSLASPRSREDVLEAIAAHLRNTGQSSTTAQELTFLGKSDAEVFKPKDKTQREKTLDNGLSKISKGFCVPELVFRLPFRHHLVAEYPSSLVKFPQTENLKQSLASAFGIVNKHMAGRLIKAIQKQREGEQGTYWTQPDVQNAAKASTQTGPIDPLTEEDIRIMKRHYSLEPYEIPEYPNLQVFLRKDLLDQLGLDGHACLQYAFLGKDQNLTFDHTSAVSELTIDDPNPPHHSTANPTVRYRETPDESDTDSDEDDITIEIGSTTIDRCFCPKHWWKSGNGPSIPTKQKLGLENNICPYHISRLFDEAFGKYSRGDRLSRTMLPSYILLYELRRYYNVSPFHIDNSAIVGRIRGLEQQAVEKSRRDGFIVLKEFDTWYPHWESLRELTRKEIAVRWNLNALVGLNHSVMQQLVYQDTRLFLLQVLIDKMKDQQCDFLMKGHGVTEITSVTPDNQMFPKGTVFIVLDKDCNFTTTITTCARHKSTEIKREIGDLLILTEDCQVLREAKTSSGETIVFDAVFSRQDCGVSQEMDQHLVQFYAPETKSPSEGVPAFLAVMPSEGVVQRSIDKNLRRFIDDWNRSVLDLESKYEKR
ncbi:hypothetical protein TWF173_002070 [Orbilia oligospora]|nr:hypothetical protein TWF173_002070 [Orbilia oligospora]